MRIALGRVARAFEVVGITNPVGRPVLRAFCEGRESEMLPLLVVRLPRESDGDHSAMTRKIVLAATYPALAKEHKDGATRRHLTALFLETTKSAPEQQRRPQISRKKDHVSHLYSRSDFDAFCRFREV
jgi:hypothetical protein